MQEVQKHVRSFQCPLCGRIFSQKSNANKHQLSHKVWPEGITATIPVNGNKSKYACPFCSTIVQTYPKLRTHLKQHNHLKKYMCVQPDCHISYPDINSVILHVNQFHPKPVYQCYMCSQKYFSLAEILKHQLEHDNDSIVDNKKNEKYVCTDCKKSFSSQEYLKHHQLTVSHEYPCSKCSKTFVSERLLRRHFLIHSEPIFNCRECNKQFRTKQYLKTHMRTHSNHKFICSICQVEFNRKDILKRHFLVHEKKQSFKCPLNLLGCSKTFYRKDLLKKHLQYHKKCSKYLKIDPIENDATQEPALEVVIISLDKNVH